jgi:uncharacterized protein (DUF2267 family)
MSLTTCGQIEITLHTTNLWLENLIEDLGWEDRDQACRALQVVLHALRDRLHLEVVADLGPQLPLLARGIHYEGWSPTGKPLKESEKEDFLSHIAAAFRNNPEVDPESIVWAVIKLLQRYAMSGKIRDVKHILRPGLRSLWPAREEDHGIQAYGG